MGVNLNFAPVADGSVQILVARQAQRGGDLRVEGGPGALADLGDGLVRTGVQGEHHRHRAGQDPVGEADHLPRGPVPLESRDRVAGPDPQDGVAPGTVHIGLSGPSGSAVRSLTLGGDRDEVRKSSTTAALTLLRDHLKIPVE